MKIILRLLSLILLLTTVIWWNSAGENTGWTKNQVEVQKFDPVLEITYPVYEKRFIPGIDFLAPGIAASLVLAGLSFLPVFRRKPVKPDGQTP